MHVGNDITQVFLQQHEILLRGDIRESLGICLRRPPRTLLFKPTDNVVNFLFRSLYPSYNFSTLDPLECEDLVELRFEFRDEELLILFGPRRRRVPGGVTYGVLALFLRSS